MRSRNGINSTEIVYRHASGSVSWSKFRNVRGLAGHHCEGELLTFVGIGFSDSFQLLAHEFHKGGKYGITIGTVASTPVGSF